MPDDGKVKAQKKVTIYTDGSSLGNPGPGGYGVVMMHGPHRKEICGGFRLTTNNRMEILAAIVALRALKPTHRCKVTIHTDSRLLVDAIGKNWLKKWQATGWRKSDKKPVLNKDLWLDLIQELRNHDVSFEWVRGHIGVPENERCDVLANTTAHEPNLPPDTEYELVVKTGLKTEE